MNWKNKYFLVTLRTIFGLMWIFSGVSGLLMGANAPAGSPENMVLATRVLWDTGLFQMIKVTEIVAGVMFLLGFLPALAAIFIAPVCIGIIVFDIMIAPSFAVIGIVLSAINAYFGYAYWDKYKALFRRR